jgi:hypothetical protein
MSSLTLMLIFLDGVFHFASHERIRILLEDAQAGVSTEIESPAAINGAWIIGWVFEFASAGSFVYEQWGGGSFSHISVFVMV